MVDNIPKHSITQTIGQSLKVKGDVSFENITQIGHQTVIQGEIFFEEISVEKFNPKDFDSPRIAMDMAVQIETQKILIIEGDRRVRKADLARHIAYLIKNKNQKQEIHIKESIRNLNLGLNLQHELQKAEKSTIFLLSDISFKTFGASLIEVKRLAELGNHYIIAATDDLKEAWRSESKDFFCKISFNEIENYKHLIDNLSDENLIRDWYYNKLDSREQLLAIALSLFDESYSDQFFAALEQLVEKVWQRRDSSLRALDYCDLDKLLSFFSFSGKNEQEETIKVTSSRQRRLLLKVAWTSHRRQILSTLPILVSLVKDSLNSLNSSELYGTEERSARLRQVIGETISNISLMSQDGKVVEEKLISLASDKNIEVQLVTANALALWRNNEKRDLIQDTSNSQNEADNKLFETIERWQEQAQITSLIDSFLKNEDYKTSEQPVDYIRATIALTVGLASEADPYDQMSEYLLKLLKNLIIDKNKLVQNRVLSDTLPRIVRRHTRQIGIELKAFLVNADIDLIVAVSKSLSEAYKFRPDAVLEILKSWQNESEENRPSKALKRRVALREVMISVVALTYGELESNEQDNSLNADKIFKNFQNILSQEFNPFVRSLVIIAVGRKAQKNFSQVEQQLQVLVSQVTKDERQSLSNILTEIHLEQRLKLSGGDETIEIQNKKYSVWLNSQKPLTDVEKAMLRWAKDDRNPMAQQVATRTSANFAQRFDREESQKIEELREKLGVQQAKVFEEYASPVLGGQPPQDWYLGKLIPWLTTRNAENYQTSIRNLLPEVLTQHRQNLENMNFVLRKWHNSSDLDIKTISDKLKSGILLAENLKWGIVGAALISIGLLSSAVNHFQRNSTNILSSSPNPPSSSPFDTPSSTIQNKDAINQSKDITNAKISGDPNQQKNVRAGTTTDTEVLFQLPVGRRVRVIESRRNSDNYLWYKIYSPQYQKEGWIAGHLIQLD